MFHHNYNHGKPHNFQFTGHTLTPSERILLSSSANVHGESGLVLSTDAKPRLKWTPELHERFIEAVNQLGGAEKATPKTVMRIMGIPGLTLYQLKSHLQKYRLSKNLHGQTSNRNTTKNGCSGTMERSASDMTGTATVAHSNFEAVPSKSLQITEALHMQIEVQRKLHEQLEVQRHLQLRIEAQGKYLQTVLEKAQETLGKQSIGSTENESAKLQFSDQVSKESSNYCLSPYKFESNDQMLQLHNQQCLIADCSIDSCLTTCDGPLKDQDMNDCGMHCKGSKVEKSNVGRCQESMEWKLLVPERVAVFPPRGAAKDLSLKASEKKRNQRNTDEAFEVTRKASRAHNQLTWIKNLLAQIPNSTKLSFKMRNVFLRC